jgi:hypothetical protein
MGNEEHWVERHTKCLWVMKYSYSTKGITLHTFQSPQLSSTLRYMRQSYILIDLKPWSSHSRHGMLSPIYRQQTDLPTYHLISPIHFNKLSIYDRPTFPPLVLSRLLIPTHLERYITISWIPNQTSKQTYHTARENTYPASPSNKQHPPPHPRSSSPYAPSPAAQPLASSP